MLTPDMIVPTRLSPERRNGWKHETRPGGAVVRLAAAVVVIALSIAALELAAAGRPDPVAASSPLSLGQP